MALLTEADTCRKYVVPKLYAAGWDDEKISEQRSFTDGRIVLTGNKFSRRVQKRADYLLRYRRDFPIAIVEAKAAYKKPGDGLQQAKDYAEILGLKFAYATNGHGIVEHDFTTGKNLELTEFPSPDDLWKRLRNSESISTAASLLLLTPYYHLSGKSPRYYQEIAINRSVQAILQGKQRVLLTMATGTGKTIVAFQVCWKLWNARWNRTGDYRFASESFSWLIVTCWWTTRRTRPSLHLGTRAGRLKVRPTKAGRCTSPLIRPLPRMNAAPVSTENSLATFSTSSSWTSATGAAHVTRATGAIFCNTLRRRSNSGMTATPLREDNRDTYSYFGNPLYIYSLRQGIDDGFLAPYRVHRIITTADAAGWRPSKGELDRFGREIPDAEYGTKDFERVIALRARTEAIARNLTEFLMKNDRFAKTIIFCVDMDHAEAMRYALNNLNADLAHQYPDYVVRVVSDEGKIGRGHLDRFMELETTVPTLVTTSQMLTTGVDVPTCKNIVLARVINSMTDFKQIIGRGSRVRDDYGKYFFSILDYTGSATRLFADPDFDGDPALITEEEMSETGEPVSEPEVLAEQDVGAVQEPPPDDLSSQVSDDDTETQPRKFYVDQGSVEIAAHLVYELDADGKQLRVVRFTDYTAEKVRSMCPSAAALRSKWSSTEERATILEALAERGISLQELMAASQQPDADPFDLLCNVAFNAPLRTRRERAEALRREQKGFFEGYDARARQVLTDILEKYIDYGVAQFQIPEILKVPPISERGTVIEITAMFGGAEKLRTAVNQMQALLYA